MAKEARKDGSTVRSGTTWNIKEERDVTEDGHYFSWEGMMNTLGSWTRNGHVPEAVQEDTGRTRSSTKPSTT